MSSCIVVTSLGSMWLLLHAMRLVYTGLMIGIPIGFLLAKILKL